MQMRRVLFVIAAVLLLTVPASSLLVAAFAGVQAPAEADGAGTALPRNFAGGAAVIITCLLLLLYLYRRRPYILYWVGGWAYLAGSLFVGARPYTNPKVGALAYGASQLFAIASSALFLIGADAYHARRRWPQLVLMLPLAIWFLLAPLALGAPAAFVPGHVLNAMALAAAGAAYMVICRKVRLLGAGLIGTTFAIAALTNIWLAATSGPSVSLVSPEAFLFELALYFIIALGMQLMTFEDMTCELRQTNSRLETAQRELRQMVITDPLTGCRNRRFFDEIIAHEMSQHRRYDTPLSLLFIDVDQFKGINDTMGHGAGDRALRDIAGFLMRKTRDADYVFRWGGDEFLLLLSCREDEALRRGAELQVEFPRSPVSSDLPPMVGLSYGCAEVSPHADTVADAIKLADERMYANKRRVRLPDVKAV